MFKNLFVLGIDFENVYLMWGYDWVIKIKVVLIDDSIKNVVVVGLGYIGIEVVEVFVKKGKYVILFDFIDCFFGNYFNYEMIEIIDKMLIDNGV